MTFIPPERLQSIQARWLTHSFGYFIILIVHFLLGSPIYAKYIFQIPFILTDGKHGPWDTSLPRYVTSLHHPASAEKMSARVESLRVSINNFWASVQTHSSAHPLRRCCGFTRSLFLPSPLAEGHHGQNMTQSLTQTPCLSYSSEVERVATFQGPAGESGLSIYNIMNNNWYITYNSEILTPGNHKWCNFLDW